MSCEAKYWIWLQNCVGYGNDTEQIICYFGDAEQCMAAGFNEWYNSGCFTKRMLEKMKNTSLATSEMCVERCEKSSYKILTPDMTQFPERLKHINSVPLALFVKGNVDVLSDEMSIAMVGTRTVSSHGAFVADKLAFELSQAGFTVVSGGAIGVDSVSHNAVLRAGGKTIGVLGCGFGVNYLPKSEDMRKNILKNGALVTEFQPGTPPSRTTFPIRNRLISGLSLGTVVVEASVKSGSLITAGFALNQGRDVFAVPGPAMDNDFAGTNQLIRDGACLVSDTHDIIDHYSIEYSDSMSKSKYRYDNGKVDYSNTKKTTIKPSNVENKTTYIKKSAKTENVEKITRKETNEKNVDENTINETNNEINQADLYRCEPVEQETVILPDFVSDDAKKVFDELSTEPIHVDKIAELTSLPIQEVMSALTELEIFGCAKAHPGQMFTLY